MTRSSHDVADGVRSPRRAADRRNSNEMHRPSNNNDGDDDDDNWPSEVGPGWEPRKFSLTTLGVIEPVRKKGSAMQSSSTDRYSLSTNTSMNTSQSQSQSQTHPDGMV